MLQDLQVEFQHAVLKIFNDSNDGFTKEKLLEEVRSQDSKHTVLVNASKKEIEVIVDRFIEYGILSLHGEDVYKKTPKGQTYVNELKEKLDYDKNLRKYQLEIGDSTIKTNKRMRILTLVIAIAAGLTFFATMFSILWQPSCKKCRMYKSPISTFQCPSIYPQSHRSSLDSSRKTNDSLQPLKKILIKSK